MVNILTYSFISILIFSTVVFSMDSQMLDGPDECSTQSNEMLLDGHDGCWIQSNEIMGLWNKSLFMVKPKEKILIKEIYILVKNCQVRVNYMLTV